MSITEARQEIYENRIRRAAAKNPDISLSEARGHKPKPLPENATQAQKQVRALSEKQSQLSLRQKLEEIPKKDVQEAKKIINEMKTSLRRMERIKDHAPGEWTIWSQQQKEREVNAQSLLKTFQDKEQAKAQKNLDKLIELGQKVQKLKPGTKTYQNTVDRMTRLYEGIEQSGFLVKDNQIIRTEGYSPEAQKAINILTQMQDLTKTMYDNAPPGDPNYHKYQQRLRRLYAKLEKMGLVSRKGDITAGDVGYH